MPVEAVMAPAIGAVPMKPTPGLEPGTPSLPQFRVATRTASERTGLRGPGGGSSSPGRQRALDAGRGYGCLGMAWVCASRMATGFELASDSVRWRGRVWLLAVALGA